MYIEMYNQGMPKRYSIAEARSNLSAIVDEAESGQQIEITRRGNPVAVVVSLRELARLRGERGRFGDAYQRFIQEHPPEQAGIEEGFFDAIRRHESGRKVKL
jgi:prevent-host-death family protein